MPTLKVLVRFWLSRYKDGFQGKELYCDTISGLFPLGGVKSSASIYLSGCAP